jgi:AcrR family transcriptional regulator
LVIVERGFDGVTVSEMTVFNYFPTKEDLAFGRMEFFEEQLVAAAQQRAPEGSAVAAFGRMVLADIDQLAARTEMIAKAATLIRASLALQAREREITARYTARLVGVSPSRRGQPPAH